MIVGYKDKRTGDVRRGRIRSGHSKASSSKPRGGSRSSTRRRRWRRCERCPGNRLESLRGERKGQYSIRINRQWRICFTWPGDLGANRCRDRGLPLARRPSPCSSAPCIPERSSRRNWTSWECPPPSSRARSTCHPTASGQIIAGKRSVSADTALRFGHWFGVEAQFWLNLQTQFDLIIAEQASGAAIQDLPSAATRLTQRRAPATAHPTDHHRTSDEPPARKPGEVHSPRSRHHLQHLPIHHLRDDPPRRVPRAGQARRPRRRLAPQRHRSLVSQPTRGLEKEPTAAALDSQTTCQANKETLTLPSSDVREGRPKGLQIIVRAQELVVLQPQDNRIVDAVYWSLVCSVGSPLCL